MKTYFELREELYKWSNHWDTELSHIMADKLITEVALHTELTKEQRIDLVNLYNITEKWCA